MGKYKFTCYYGANRQTIIVRAVALTSAWKQAAKLGAEYAQATKQTLTAIDFEGAN